MREPITDLTPSAHERPVNMNVLQLSNGRKVPLLRTTLNIDVANKDRSIIYDALLNEHKIDIKSPQYVWRCLSKSQRRPVSSDKSPYEASIEQLEKTASDKPISNDKEVFVSDISGAELTWLGFGSLVNDFSNQYVSTILMYNPSLIPDLDVTSLPEAERGAALASKMFRDFQTSQEAGYTTLLDFLSNIIEIRWTK